jgi:hypothetical protein
MRIHVLAGAAIYLAAATGCSGELAQRPAATDPTSVAAAEAPFTPPPAYQADPLLSPVQLRGPEPSPTGTEPAHSATSLPPGNPPYREPPGARRPMPPSEQPGAHDHGAMPGMQQGAHGAPAPPPPQTFYTCPMHPQVRATRPGQCPLCGMTLVPMEPAK